MKICLCPQCNCILEYAKNMDGLYLYCGYCGFRTGIKRGVKTTDIEKHITELIKIFNLRVLKQEPKKINFNHGDIVMCPSCDEIGRLDLIATCHNDTVFPNSVWWEKLDNSRGIWVCYFCWDK